jgi:putative ABC transport system permease protein
MGSIKRGVRNTFRNTIRTVAVVTILAVAIALSISMLIARGAVSAKIASVRDSTGTTITVSPKGFFGFQGGGSPLSASTVTSLLSLPHVAALQETLNQELSSANTSLIAATPTGQLGQQFGGGAFTRPIRVVGTNSPGTALVGGAFGGGTEKIVTGTSFSSTSDADVAILGTNLASANQLVVGSTFTAWSTNVTVIGIYSAGSTFADNNVVMPLTTVQRLSNQAGEITGATVTVDTLSHVAATTTLISQKLGSAADVTSTAQATQSSLAPLDSVQTISTYTLVGAVVGAGIILLLSMLMIVRERRREIGVLKAIGASTGSIIRQFIAESTTFTVLGSVVGVGVGVLLSSPIASALVSASGGSSPGGGFVRRGGGFPGGFAGGGNGFTPPGGVPTGPFRFGGFGRTLTQLHTSVGWGTLSAAFAIAILVAVVGASVAVASVVRVRPAEVLRSE